MTYILLSYMFIGGFGVADFDSKVYSAYVHSNIPSWEITVLEASMHTEKASDEDKYRLALSYYGLVGAFLGKERKEKAGTYLKKAIRLTESLVDADENDSRYLALRGALLGFEIALSSYKAMYLGPQSLNYIDEAIEKNPENPTAWIEYGNALYYMPKFVGGDRQKAIQAYKKAIRLFEAGNTDNCWLYLNSLAVLGQWYENSQQYYLALEHYRKALRVAPNFKWVKMELLPQLECKI
ncbi:MAG: tetratricopeptide repeat protein [Salinivirgaceae bacterium]|jgi:tetratricopeptide (TPR) repeat protein|nr:tetratricopeptide repeat protein [Salinivirgaceae bacterium]